MRWYIIQIVVACAIYFLFTGGLQSTDKQLNYVAAAFSVFMAWVVTLICVGMRDLLTSFKAWQSRGALQKEANPSQQGRIGRVGRGPSLPERGLAADKFIETTHPPRG